MTALINTAMNTMKQKLAADKNTNISGSASSGINPLNLLCVRSVLMLSTYTEDQVLYAYETIKSLGKKLSVDSLLDELHNNDDKYDTIQTTWTHEQRPKENSKLHDSPLEKANVEQNEMIESYTTDSISPNRSKLAVDKSNHEEQKWSSSELQKLEEENERMKIARTCRSCNRRQADIIVLPCRHISVCHVCWDPTSKSNNCLTCKSTVAGMFHVFWS